MMNKKSLLTVFFLLITCSMLTLKVAADDDEDDTVGEIATDLLIGVGIAICEEFAMCQLFMFVAGVIGLIICLIGLCSGEVTFADICNSQNSRRGLTTGVGYGLVRSFRRY